MHAFTKNVLFAAGLLMALAASPAQAADSAQQIAEAHFKTGLKQYDAGNYEVARLEFLQAQAVYPRASLLRNLAMCELKTNRPLEAVQHLRAYLADPSTTGDRRENAKKNFDEAFARTGHLTVRATDGATLSVDGQLQPGSAPFKDPIDVLPGRHVLEVRLGERSASREVDAAAGVLGDLDVRFEEKAAAAPSPVTTSSASVTSDMFVAPPHDEAPSRSFWTTQRIVGAGLAGVGLAALGGALYFHLDGANEADRASALRARIPNGACASGASPVCADLQRAYDAKDRDLVIRNVALAVGGASVAAGAVLVVWPSSSSSSSRGRVTPLVGPNVAGVQLRGELP